LISVLRPITVCDCRYCGPLCGGAEQCDPARADVVRLPPGAARWEFAFTLLIRATFWGTRSTTRCLQLVRICS